MILILKNHSANKNYNIIDAGGNEKSYFRNAVMENYSLPNNFAF